jgi:hypothetical protein
MWECVCNTILWDGHALSIDCSFFPIWALALLTVCWQANCVPQTSIDLDLSNANSLRTPQFHRFVIRPSVHQTAVQKHIVLVGISPGFLRVSVGDLGELPNTTPRVLVLLVSLPLLHAARAGNKVCTKLQNPNEREHKLDTWA